MKKDTADSKQGRSSVLGLLSFALLLISVALFIVGSGRDEAEVFMTASFWSMMLSGILSIVTLFHRNSKKLLAVITLFLIAVVIAAVLFIFGLFGSAQVFS